MSKYAHESGIAITDVRVSNFRSLANVEVELGDLTVLIGANNAGKTSFLDALFAAVGTGRKLLGQDDVRLDHGESMVPKNRQVIVDVRIRPIGDEGTIVEKFPEGSFWTSLWGTAIVQDFTDFQEFMAFRTTLAWSVSKGDYQVDRKPLKEWRTFDDWLSTPTQEKSLLASQLEPVALHYIDAKRDLEDNLADLQELVSADSGGIDIAPSPESCATSPRASTCPFRLQAPNPSRYRGMAWEPVASRPYWSSEPSRPGVMSTRRKAETRFIRFSHSKSQSRTCIRKRSARCSRTSRPSPGSALSAHTRPISQGRLSLRIYASSSKKAAIRYKNVMMVGDPKQSIYGFNTSSPEYMDRFRDEFGAKVIELTANYRSSKAIAEVTRSLDPHYLVAAQLPIPGMAKVLTGDHEEDEAKLIVDELQRLFEEGHPDVEGTIEPSKCAILGRTRFALLAVEKELRDRRILFYKRLTPNHENESEAVDDFQLALRVVANPRDRLHFSALAKKWKVTEPIAGSDSVAVLSGMARGSFDAGERATAVVEAIEGVVRNTDRLDLMPAFAALRKYGDTLDENARLAIYEDVVVFPAGVGPIPALRRSVPHRRRFHE